MNASASAHAFSISDGAMLTVYGLSIVDLNASNSGIAIDCEPSTGSVPPMLTLDQVSIDATNNAILGYPCTVTVTRSHLHVRTPTIQVFMGLGGTIANFDRTMFDGGDGLVSAGSGAVTHVTNSVIANQTGSDGAFIGGSVFGSPAGSMFVSFSTVINSAVKCGSGTPVCLGGTAPGSCVDNTIIFNGASGAPIDTVTGSACNARYSLVYPQSAAIGGSNNKLGVNAALVNAANGDYHLAAGSPAIDAADPLATNDHDFEGISRPQAGRDDMGAYEYKP